MALLAETRRPIRIGRTLTMTTVPARPRSITPVIAIFLVALAPVVFALLAYYVPALGLRPAIQTNYGQLLEPQRPIPDTLTLRDESGAAVRSESAQRAMAADQHRPRRLP